VRASGLRGHDVGDDVMDCNRWMWHEINYSSMTPLSRHPFNPTSNLVVLISAKILEKYSSQEDNISILISSRVRTACRGLAWAATMSFKPKSQNGGVDSIEQTKERRDEISNFPPLFKESDTATKQSTSELVRHENDCLLQSEDACCFVCYNFFLLFSFDKLFLPFSFLCREQNVSTTTDALFALYDQRGRPRRVKGDISCSRKSWSILDCDSLVSRRRRDNSFSRCLSIWTPCGFLPALLW
jgi:hypothetical protein